MAIMTTEERVGRMFNHQEADRMAIYDIPWASTIERWEREGMPKGTDYIHFFGLDAMRDFRSDNSPRYPVRTIEETEAHKIHTSPWGVTLKQWKHAASTPEFLDFTIVDRDRWFGEAKKRIDTAPDRIPWELLRNNYPKWKKEGAWIQATLLFGFDLTHSFIVGTERLLMALIEDPEWVMDMFDTQLTTQLRQLDLIWEKGYRFNMIRWCDDMGYKKNQFFSVPTYRQLLKPFHKRAIEWAHAHGIKAYLHSCGDINPFIPEFLDMGLDMLNPLEVKAGIDPYHLKKTFGCHLAFHGGMNALLYDDPQALEAEVEKLVPAMKEKGGYIFGSDHSVPDSVSLTGFQALANRAKELGTY